MQRADPLSECRTKQFQHQAQSCDLTGYQEFCGEVTYLLAVALTPGSWVQHHKQAKKPTPHDIAPATLPSPISAMRADSASRSLTACSPDAVMR